MRLIFMGSPNEVIAPLEHLISHAKNHGHILIAVVSQPAKPAGRKMLLTDPPVAAFAKEQGIVCLQPTKASDAEFLDQLRALSPDVIITAAYGQILSSKFLEIPTRGTINIHPSLLPLYRGAIPVPAAILDGHTETGVSILFTVKALDAGNIIVQKKYSIGENEDALELTRRMFDVSGPLLMESLAKLEDPNFTGEAQDEAKVTLCKKISKSDGAIDWAKPAKSLLNEFRAYQPWPGVYTERQGVRIVLEAMQSADGHEDLSAGEFTFDKKLKSIVVGTSDGRLAIAKLKSAGSKSMDAAGFWNGLRTHGSERFTLKVGE